MFGALCVATELAEIDKIGFRWSSDLSHECPRRESIATKVCVDAAVALLLDPRHGPLAGETVDQSGRTAADSIQSFLKSKDGIQHGIDTSAGQHGTLEDLALKLYGRAPASVDSRRGFVTAFETRSAELEEANDYKLWLDNLDVRTVRGSSARYYKSRSDYFDGKACLGVAVRLENHRVRVAGAVSLYQQVKPPESDAAQLARSLLDSILDCMKGMPAHGAQYEIEGDRVHVTLDGVRTINVAKLQPADELHLSLVSGENPIDAFNLYRLASLESADSLHGCFERHACAAQH